MSRDALLQEMLHGARRKAAEPSPAGTAAQLRDLDGKQAAAGAPARPAGAAAAGAGLALATGAGGDSADASSPADSNPPVNGAGELQEAALAGQRERPAKRPCLQLQRSTPPTSSSARVPSPPTASLAAAAAPPTPAPSPPPPAPSPPPPAAGALAADGFPVPREHRGSLPCLIEARSLGRLRPPAQQALWLERRPALAQAAGWDAALRQRLPSVLHQDAITQIELSGAGSGSGGIRLAVAQANQCVRIVPYGVLRDAALEARARRREAAEAADESDDERSDDEGGGGGASRRLGTSSASAVTRRVALQPWDELAHRGIRIGAFCSSTASTAAAPSNTAPSNTAAAAAAAAPSNTVAAASSRPPPSSCVHTLSLRQHVSALGWDPRRPGRLAVVDRASPNVLLLDLGASRQDMVRSHLTAAAPAAAVASLGAAATGGLAGGGGGAAARNLVYLRYPRALDAPYSLAAAGRAGGPDGAAVHLWDERAGRGPVARLVCPGGAALVAPLEAPGGEPHCLVGVVHPSTLVVWDVRSASSGLGGGLKPIGQGGTGGGMLSLGSSRPHPAASATAAAATTAVVGAWDVRAPLAALGCWQPVVGGLAADPRDSRRLALLLMDGSTALWNLAAGGPSHAYPAPSPLTAAYEAAAAAAADIVVAAGPAGAAGIGGGGGGSGSVTAASLAALLSSRPAALGDAVAATAAAAGPLGGLKGVCGLVGALQGAWDADVCGFWHPTALLRHASSSSSSEAVGAAAAAAATRPGLVLSDFRTGSRNAELASAAVAEAMAAAAATRSSGPAGAAASAAVAAAATAVPSASSASSLAAAALAAAQLRRRAAALAVPLESWPLGVACVGETGDVICGTLGGELLHWTKA
ncbi:hypothetical protein HYH02_003215 [Chlamydomonas schloesseri]|uniref:Uncharacterized protein n=1 Tax=Chlamydomonas schloesseri TaxID=2026947 RepID=A0A836BAL4_9CHLO|nr:hypothetical protein HYH02_003215 [Chlamydomonas schloesseri]|eukprot:KAG2452184.1 hypothetical protein HYH02_003215 [Chlamydomonas schloesseri]